MKITIKTSECIKNMTLINSELHNAVKCCLNMAKASEVDCCSRCPLKRYNKCYNKLIKELYARCYIYVIDFVEHLKLNVDFILQDESGENPIAFCIDVDKLDKHLQKYFNNIGIELE